MRKYAVPFGPTALTATFDIFEVAPADDKQVTLLGIVLGQTTEIGDAQEEMLEVIITRGGTAMTSGSGGSAATPVPLDPADTAFGGTVEVLNTTKATFTSGLVVHRDAFNVRVGWQYMPPPEQWIEVTQANGGLSASIPGTPVDSITFAGTVYLGEG